MKVLLVTPPMTQLGTPYPATPYLTGFLQQHGHSVVQADPALAWVLRLLSPHGLAAVLATLPAKSASRAVRHLRANAEAMTRQVPVAVAFLQGKDPSMAPRIAGRRYLCEGPRFANVGPQGHEEEYLNWAFGNMGVLDRARYFATLFLEDVADAIRDGIDPHFDFARYGESLAQSQPSLDPLLEALAAPANVATDLLHALSDELLAEHRPDVVGMTLPFPGNVLGALRMAQRMRARNPQLRILWGGGYINTELRSLSDPRLFRFVDALTYDDGEAPLLRLLAYLRGHAPRSSLLRTRMCQDARTVEWLSDPTAQDVAFKDTGCPTYRGLPLGDYLAMFDMLNPMHRLWSDTRWNKLTMAHGCYWKKCSFCDISLDYIGRYAPLTAPLLVDRMEALLAETGQRGFHFVDEAAPPASLKAMSEEILRRGLQVSWWANIRFEKTFTPELCQLLARAGCIAVSGGLEVASDRLLKLMQKGVSVEQVARVTQGFYQAGVMVHAYLMYGFPSQTAQETLDSLEMVRQLFDADCITSAFWHRFAATAHAPVGQNPAAYGIRLLPTPPSSFGQNDLPFVDDHGADPGLFGAGLRKAVYNYMHGMGLEDDVRVWFDAPVPKPQVPRNFVQRALRAAAPATATKPRHAAPSAP